MRVYRIKRFSVLAKNNKFGFIDRNGNSHLYKKWETHFYNWGRNNRNATSEEIYKYAEDVLKSVKGEYVQIAISKIHEGIRS